MTVQIKNRNKKSTLSMRAAQEAQNGIAETLVNLNTTREGLQEAQANARLERDGLNEVTHDKPPHALIQLLMAFNNPFIYVLAILAGISFFTDYWLPTSHGEDGDLTTVIIIGTMVALSGLVRFWQEHRSAKSAEALKAMVRTTATVVRREHAGQKGTPREIPMRELVVGDIVQLYAGDMIPADVRLIESRDLFISQAVLTGEALPIEKYDTLATWRRNPRTTRRLTTKICWICLTSASWGPTLSAAPLRRSWWRPGQGPTLAHWQKRLSAPGRKRRLTAG
ncbi:magnesium-translocating P-type ATPase [Klebsiella variicola]|nr:magnesium-translocating P-type ATPase [Klebsiella variicola]